MPIVGGHPETGVRFALERAVHGGPPWLYRGEAWTPEARIALEIVVTVEGDVRVRSDGDAPVELIEKARLLFRALFKQASATPGAEPPRRVVRWRGEK
jgi:hypothetical protein